MKLNTEDKLDEGFVDYTIKEVANTNHKHYLVFAGFNNDMEDYICRNCPHGVQVEKDKFKIKSGKLVRK